jgi:hypothetical protein
MKKFLFILSFFVCVSVFASGKLIIKPIYNVDTDTPLYTIGLNIYEKLFKDLAYNSWTGLGEPAYHTDEQWFVTKHQFDMFAGGLTISPGFSFNYYSRESGNLDYNVFLSVSYILWN